MRTPGGQRILGGIGASEGIAIGKAFLLERRSLAIKREDLNAHEVDAEVRRFRASVAESMARLDSLRQRSESLGIGGSASVVAAYVSLLKDPWITDQTEALIAREGVNAEWALERSLERVRDLFRTIEDDTIRERLQDIEFVAERLFHQLLGVEIDHLHGLQPDHIVFAHQLSPVDGLHLFRRGVSGFVTEVGAKTSHLGIMARTHGVPAVVGLHGALDEVQEGDLVLVDGASGAVAICPEPDTLRSWSDRQRQLYLLNQSFYEHRERPSVTLDGRSLRVSGNIDLPDEAAEIQRLGGDGVGLFRTEYLFLDQDSFPSEELQITQYKEVAARFPLRGATIRTLDLGGDKFLSLRGAEGNPDTNIDGLRAIRLCLARPDLFKTQLRALYRASLECPLRILIPFVTTLDEVWQVRAILKEVSQELCDADCEVEHEPELGLMVEIPSVAILADHFVQHADFLSIGTNDLIQYALAVERDNELVSYLYQPLNPAVLRLLAQVAEAGKRYEKPVSVCGAMASNPLFVPLFVGLGIDELSCSPRAIPLVKETLRALDAKECEALVESLLEMHCHRNIERALVTFVNERLPELEPLIVAQADLEDPDPSASPTLEPLDEPGPSGS